MRVLGEIPHPVFKITVFIHNDRFTLQVENGIFSQHYRVRKKPGIECLDDFCQVVDKTFWMALPQYLIRCMSTGSVRYWIVWTPLMSQSLIISYDSTGYSCKPFREGEMMAGSLYSFND